MAIDSWQVEYGFGGGWIRTTSDTFDGWLYLRFALDQRRRPYLAEIYFDGQGTELTQRTMRELPLTNLIAFVLSDQMEWLERSTREPGPQLSLLASHFATLWAGRSDWIADSMRAQLPARWRQDGSEVDPPTNPEPGAVPPENQKVEAPAPIRYEGGELTDDFLRSVAENYTWLRGQGVWPVVPALKPDGVSARTVNNWISKARDRGLLPPVPRRKGS